MAENNYDLEYTGSMVDRILDTGYDLQNQGYIFRGLASHYTGTPTERTWLIAPTGSTGFGLSSPVPPGSIGICMYNGSSWYAEVLNTLTLDTAPTTGSGNGITSGAVKTLAESITNAIGQLEQSVSDRFTSLELEDTTGSLQEEVLSITLKYVFEGETEALTSLSILAATSEKAGLMSAADKQKLDAFVTNIRSLRIQDTTAQADQDTEITNTLKWTIGGVTEAITAFTLYAATTSKAGLMSAADKTALDTLPSLINAGYLYAGIATPSTVPSTTSAKIFYIAIEGGTYTSFGSLSITQGINILYKSGNAWSVAQAVGIDNEPTAGSDNLVKSGGVKTELALGAVYDVSAHNNGATFESLSALLSDTDLNALIPTAVRKGGMSIKFVQSSDNKYVQYRLMNNTWSAIETDWQGVDDEPTAGSENLVKSGGVEQGQKGFSQLCYTKSKIGNKAILVFFADTSNSEENIENIKIRSIANNMRAENVSYYGIQFAKNGSHWGEYYIHENLKNFSFTLNNIYFHIIINWDNIEEGQISLGDTDIINYDLKENDDRVLNSIQNRLTQDESNINNLNEQIEIIRNNLYEKFEYDVSLLSNNGYIDYSSGQEVTPSSRYKYSNLINLKKGESIEYSCVSGSTAAILSVYENNQYIKSKSIHGGGESEQERKNITFIAQENCQIRLCACIGYSVIITIYKFVVFSDIAKNIFFNKKWACVGDSLTAINEATTKHYFDYVKDDTGIIPLNFGYSGSGYAKYNNLNKAFYQRVLNIPLDTDIVTIFGSFNDLEILDESFRMGEIDDNTTNTLCGCINQTITNLYTILPTIQLGIVTPSPWQYRRPTKNGNSLAEEYVNNIKSICKLRSIPCLDLFICSNLRPWEESFRNLVFYNGDGVHPNEIGHKLIAGQFFDFLNKIFI